MAQATLLKYVKPRKKLVEMYRFVQDLPEIMGPNGEAYGPFKAGDLVGINDIPKSVWKLLVQRNVVVPYRIRW